MSKNRHASCAMVAMLAVLGSAVVTGCDDKSEPDWSCDLPYAGTQVAGDWTLRGHGERAGCDDREFEGALDIAIHMPITIEAKAVSTPGPATGSALGSEADAFVSRIERADFKLSASGLPQDVAFTGTSVGSCVDFSITETLPGGGMQVYKFEGYIVSSGAIEGRFTGDGPENCVSSGRFDVTIQ